MKSGFLLLYLAFAGPHFEVASVKLAPTPAELFRQGQTPPRPVNDAAHYQTYTSLLLLVRSAYRLERYQTLTGPDWMSSTWLQIAAQMPEGAKKEQIPEMLQALLDERFKLSVRRETAERPVYFLTVAKDGPKLKDAPAGDLTSARPFPNGPGDRLLFNIADFGADGWRTYSRLNGVMMFEAPRIDMRALTAVLSAQVDTPVIDRSGLTGAYEISMPVPYGPNGAGPNPLLVSRGGLDSGTPPTQAADPSGADVFKSIEKLGLRLEKGKAPIESIAVEHVEKTPIEN
jgi:uncharacterized protein (TIGR03435 family)